MPVRITCPGCGSSIAVQPADQGRTIRCVVCHSFVAVPVIERADVAPPPPPPTTTTTSARTSSLPGPSAPPRKTRSVWPIIGLACIVLGAVGAIAFIVHRGAGAGDASQADASEREIHDKVLQLKGEAEALAIDGKLAEAHAKYREIMALAGGRRFKDPLLFDTIEQAKTDQDRIYNILLRTMEQQVGITPKPGSLDAAGASAAAAQGQSAQPSQPTNATASVPTYPPAFDALKSGSPAPATAPSEAASNAPTAEAVAPPSTETSPQPEASAPTSVASVPALSRPVPRKLPPSTQQVLDRQVGDSIKRGVDFLLSNVDKDHVRQQAGDTTDAEVAGLNALCVYALLQAGQATGDERLNPRGPLMKSMIDRMKKDAMTTDAMTQAPVVYARSLRTAALAVHNRPEDHAVMRDDVAWLVRVAIDGAYTYDDRFNRQNQGQALQQQQQQQPQLPQQPPGAQPMPGQPLPGQAPGQPPPQIGGQPPPAPGRYIEPATTAPSGDGDSGVILFHGKHNPDGSEPGSLAGPQAGPTFIPGPAFPRSRTGPYPPPPPRTAAAPQGPNVRSVWDNSNSQFGLLGVWSGAECGVEVLTPYWRAVEKHWVECQSLDGQWSYSAFDTQPTYAMTVAGVASLFVTHDYLEAPMIGKVNGREPYGAALRKGLGWLEQRDHSVGVIDAGTKYVGYNLFAMERAALASGFKFFGGHDWYRELATRIIPTQWPSGAFGRGPDGFDAITDTAFTLLFLSRGRSPVMMNKLRFELYWANRPRDVANLARFAGRQLERPLNWQVVDAADEHDWPDWMEAPIVMIASHEAPSSLSPQAMNKLRGFANAGGMIFTHADAGSKAFSDYVETQLVRQLFPAYEMRDVPITDPVYNANFTPKGQLPKLRGVSNGSRWLLIHSPQDITLSWQTRNEKVERKSFELGTNLFVYAAGLKDLRNRLDSPYVPPPTEPPAFTTKVARLSYAGSWDPEPYAWTRFARWFQWETDQALDVQPIAIAQLKPGAASLAHVTGSAVYQPSDAEIAAMRAYVDAGGALLLDACGGSPRFIKCLETDWLAKLAGANAKLEPVKPDNPLLAGTAPGTDPLPRLPVRPITAGSENNGDVKLISVKLGKGRIIYCSGDLTSGLLGINTLGIAGYQPATAQSLVKNAILLSEPTAPPPATGP